MNFEKAVLFLKRGKRIYRSLNPEKGSLAGTIHNVMGSFYLTIYDVLADDWEWCEINDPYLSDLFGWCKINQKLLDQDDKIS